MCQPAGSQCPDMWSTINLCFCDLSLSMFWKRLSVKLMDSIKQIAKKSSIIWMGLIQLQKYSEILASLLRGNCAGSQSSDLDQQHQLFLGHGLAAHSADFGLANLHYLRRQFLRINLLHTSYSFVSLVNSNKSCLWSLLSRSSTQLNASGAQVWSCLVSQFSWSTHEPPAVPCP